MSYTCGQVQMSWNLWQQTNNAIGFHNIDLPHKANTESHKHKVNSTCREQSSHSDNCQLLPFLLDLTGELHIYLDRELEAKKWSQFHVNRADKNNRRGLEPTSNSSFKFRHLGKECAKISYFDIDFKE